MILLLYTATPFPSSFLRAIRNYAATIHPFSSINIIAREFPTERERERDGMRNACSNRNRINVCTRWLCSLICTRNLRISRRVILNWRQRYNWMEWNFGIKKLLLRVFKSFRVPKHSTLQFQRRQFTGWNIWRCWKEERRKEEKKKKKKKEKTIEIINVDLFYPIHELKEEEKKITIKLA